MRHAFTLLVLVEPDAPLRDAGSVRKLQSRYAGLIVDLIVGGSACVISDSLYSAAQAFLFGIDPGQLSTLSDECAETACARASVTVLLPSQAGIVWPLVQFVADFDAVLVSRKLSSIGRWRMR